MEILLLIISIIIIIGIIIILIHIIKFNVLINKIFEEIIKNKDDIANLEYLIKRKLDRNYNIIEYNKEIINRIIDTYISKFIAKQDIIFTKVINTDQYLREYLDDLKAHRQRKRQKMNNSSTDK